MGVAAVVSFGAEFLNESTRPFPGAYDPTPQMIEVGAEELCLGGGKDR